MPIAFKTTTKGRSYLSVCGNLLDALLLPSWLGGVPRRFTMSVMKVVPDDLYAIAEMIDRKQFFPVLDSTWTFEESSIKAAYQRFMKGHSAGKMVIKILDLGRSI